MFRPKPVIVKPAMRPATQDERAHVAAKQCGVDQKLGKIRLRQADGRGQQTDERYTCQPLPVRQDEAECTLISPEPDLRSFDRHFS